MTEREQIARIIDPVAWEPWYWTGPGPNRAAELKRQAQDEALAKADDIIALRPTLPDGWVGVPVEVVEFLRGSGQLDGVWFSERHPTLKGAFWWRQYLAASPKDEAVGQD